METRIRLTPGNLHPGNRVRMNIRGVPPQILERNHLFLHRVEGESSLLVAGPWEIPASGELSVVLPARLSPGKHRLTAGALDENGAMAVNSGIVSVDLEAPGK